MKNSRRIILIAVVAYICLLAALVLLESRAPDASIHSFWDAIWYSIITMTTVGYGDLSPVTPLGRVVGVIFALCSIGILAALIGAVVHLISGQAIPMLQLRRAKKKNWYVFDGENDDTAVLAKELRDRDPNGIVIFAGNGERILEGRNVVRMDADPRRLLSLRGGERNGMHLFFMGEDSWKNYASAREIEELRVPSYCMADVTAEEMSGEIVLFSRPEAISRSYWKEHPLEDAERRVVLIGCGEAGSELLERALLVNVFPGDRRTEYHVFEDTAGFARLHPQIVETLGHGMPREDKLVFHAESWKGAHELLRSADRIILCREQDEENLALYETLRTWIPTGANVHVRLSVPVSGVPSFGERASIIRPEYVMKDEINHMAMVINDIYNENASAPVKWRDLGWFLRQSNIAAADHLIVKARYLLPDETITQMDSDVCRRAYEKYKACLPEQADLFQEAEHRRWVRFHQMYNWQYAPERDRQKRLHPMIVPYEELSAEEQSKDSYAWELLGRLADRTPE